MFVSLQSTVDFGLVNAGHPPEACTHKCVNLTKSPEEFTLKRSKIKHCLVLGFVVSCGLIRIGMTYFWVTDLS